MKRWFSECSHEQKNIVLKGLLVSILLMITFTFHLVFINFADSHMRSLCLDQTTRKRSGKLGNKTVYTLCKKNCELVLVTIWINFHKLLLFLCFIQTLMFHLLVSGIVFTKRSVCNQLLCTVKKSHSHYCHRCQHH